MEVDQRRLRRREQEGAALPFVVLLQHEDVIFKLRELTGSDPALVGQQMRRKHEFVAVLEVLLDEVIEQPPLQPRAIPAVQPVSAAAHLGATLVVHETERFDQLHMIPGLKIKDRLFAPDPHDLVVFLASGHHVVGRHVG